MIPASRTLLSGMSCYHATEFLSGWPLNGFLDFGQPVVGADHEVRGDRRPIRAGGGVRDVSFSVHHRETRNPGAIRTGVGLDTAGRARPAAA